MNSIRKHTQNVIVDSLSLFCMIILTITGIMIHYKLPKGIKEATVWGLQRHDWGELHFWVAVILLLAITVHLLLHTPWIKGVVSPKKDEIKKVKLVAYSITFILILTIGLTALLSPVID